MSYQISQKTAAVFEVLTALPEVKQGLEFLQQDHQKAVQEQLEMVVIPSPTFQEEQRAAFYAEKLRELGLVDVHLDRHGNAVGLRKGSGDGPTILIEAHLDTVFPIETKIEPVIKDGKIHAPGICDDTRGLAALLSVIRAFNTTGIEHTGDIFFVGTTREEGMGGLGGMKGFLEDNGERIASSISIDGSGANRIVFNATGIKTVVYNFYGIGGHAYGAFGRVANPLHAAARAVAKIASLRVPSLPRTTYAVSNFHAGNDAGIHAITEGATIKINFRSNSSEELEKLDKAILNCVEEGCREESEFWGVDTITFDCEYLVDVPAGEQADSLPIVEATFATMSYLGLDPVFSADGSTNANMPISMGIPAVCIGRGGRESGVHTTHEWFEIEGAYRCPQNVFLIALALSGIKDKSASVI